MHRGGNIYGYRGFMGVWVYGCMGMDSVRVIYILRGCMGYIQVFVNWWVVIEGL
jgi:hypothetical protein